MKIDMALIVAKYRVAQDRGEFEEMSLILFHMSLEMSVIERVFEERIENLKVKIVRVIGKMEGTLTMAVVMVIIIGVVVSVNSGNVYKDDDRKMQSFFNSSIGGQGQNRNYPFLV